MYKKKVLGNNVLVEIIRIEHEGAVELLENSKYLDRFSMALAIGPDCKYVKLGDDVLIPQEREGRISFSLDGKNYTIFKETAVAIIREKVV